MATTSVAESEALLQCGNGWGYRLGAIQQTYFITSPPR